MTNKYEYMNNECFDILWEKTQQRVQLITQFCKLLYICLKKGETIIRIERQQCAAQKRKKKDF